MKQVEKCMNHLAAATETVEAAEFVIHSAGCTKAWFPFGHFLPFVARFRFSYQQKATTSNAMLKWKHPQKTKTSNKKP